MVALVGPAVDPTLGAPARCYVQPGGVLVVDPPELLPGPGDPDVEVPEPPGPPTPGPGWVPTVRRSSPRMSVLVGEFGSRDVLGELTTATVEDWFDDVELLAGSAATITASTFDPLWREIGDVAGLSAWGTPTAELDAKRLIVWVYRDEQPVWTGILPRPIQIGGGRVALPAVGPQEQFASRILGRPEQEDLLDDRGSFEGASPLDGWVVPGGVEAEIVTDGVRGTKALRVRGTGWVRSPRVTVDGADGYSRVVDGQVFGKWADQVPAGSVVVRAWTQRLDSGGPYDQAYTFENAGVRPDSEAGWTDDPVVCAARMAPVATAHRVWLELASFADHWSYYDLAQLRLSVQTGFPKGTMRDLSLYVERIHRDLTARSLGGHPTGLRTRVRALTGTTASMRWAHAARTSARDVLAAVLEADGGPECRITAGWWLDVWDRLGSDRDDVAITDADVVRSEWQIDAGGQVDDLIADTGRGSGVNWLSATVSQPVVDTRWRVAAMVQAPTDRTLNEVEAWAAAHARSAARLPATAEVDVLWSLADQIVTGDTLWVSLTDGGLGLHARMRVLRRRYRTGSLTCRITLGPTDA